MLQAAPAAKAVPVPAPKQQLGTESVPASPKPKAPKAVPGKAQVPKGTLQDAAAAQPSKAYPKPKPKAQGADAIQPPPPKGKQQAVVPKGELQLAPKQGKQPEINQQQLAKALPKAPAKGPAASEVLQPPKKQPPVKAPAKPLLPPKAGAVEPNQPKAVAPKQPAKGDIQPAKLMHLMPKKAPGAPAGNAVPSKVPGKATLSGPPKPKGEAANVEPSVGPPKAPKAKQNGQFLPPKVKPAAKVIAQPPEMDAPQAEQTEEQSPLEHRTPELSASEEPQGALEPENLTVADTELQNNADTEPLRQDQTESLSPVHQTPVGIEASIREKQVREQIDLDLPRTFSTTPEVDSQRASIRSVLLTYSRSNPHIGYCQGMSFPAAVLCAKLSETAAIAKFQSCLEKVRELWLPGFHIFETAKQAFDALLAHESEALAQSFQAQGVILDVFLLDAWLTIFARWLPFEMLFRVLEFVESQGFSGVLSLTVAVVNSHCESIIGVEKADALLQLWKCLQWGDSPPPLETLLAVAQGMLPKANELLAEQCTVSRPVKDVVGLAFERRGPQILHVDTGVDILDLLSQESWEKWKAQAEKFRKAAPTDASNKSEKDTKVSKNSFLSIFRCGRTRADSDDLPSKPKAEMDTE